MPVFEWTWTLHHCTAISPQAWTLILSPIHSSERLGCLQSVSVACQLVKQSLYQKAVVSPGPEMTLRTVKQEVAEALGPQGLGMLAQAPTSTTAPGKKGIRAGRALIHVKGKFPACGSRMGFTFLAEFWFNLGFSFAVFSVWDEIRGPQVLYSRIFFPDPLETRQMFYRWSGRSAIYSRGVSTITSCCP